VTPLPGTPDRALSLQERYAPSLRCFGCGPANPEGLHVRSFVGGDGVLVATWRAGPHHEAFPGVLNGGIIGTLLDCHCNWAASAGGPRRRPRRQSISAPGSSRSRTTAPPSTAS
jgi:hypothetical protein